MSMIDDSIPRYFSFYRNFDELADEYFHINLLDGQRGRNTRSDYIYAKGEKKSKIAAVYPNEAELTQVLNNYEELKQTIDSGGSFKKAKIKLSEDKRFQFSFSLASKGLTRVIEYYNEDIAQKHPNMFNRIGLPAASDRTMVAGVVDLNMVLSKPLANNATYFYIIINGTEYELRQQQKGTAKMLEINDNAVLERVENEGMYYAEPTFYGDFSLVFSSTFKKSYIELPKKGGNAKAVDLYIPFDMIYSTIEQRITSAIPLLLASQFFMQARIKVRINIMRPITAERADSTSAVSIVAITVKDFQDPIDWNKLAVLRGIERAGQTVTEMNASVLAFKQNEYKKIGGVETQWLNAYARIMLYKYEEELQGEFGRYKNWLRQEVELGNIKTPLVPKPLMLTFSTMGLLGTVFNSEVASGVYAGSEHDGQKKIDKANEVIKANFFELLDIVDLYYNEKLSEVVTRIKKRFDEKFKNEREAISALKDYLIKLLGKLYRDLEPETGAYATPADELEKSNLLYNQMLSKLRKEYEKRGI